jgi:hypothetical protein
MELNATDRADDMAFASDLVDEKALLIFAVFVAVGAIFVPRAEGLVLLHLIFRSEGKVAV